MMAISKTIQQKLRTLFVSIDYSKLWPGEARVLERSFGLFGQKRQSVAELAVHYNEPSSQIAWVRQRGLERLTAGLRLKNINQTKEALRSLRTRVTKRKRRATKRRMVIAAA